MSTENKRLAMLAKMVSSGQADSFARYAYAMELRKEGQLDEALVAFSDLRAADSNYVPQYLMAGQMLLGAGRKGEAREWLEAGLSVAQAAGDSKAVSEIGDALTDC